jgi:hypothetical protein
VVILRESCSAHGVSVCAYLRHPALAGRSSTHLSGVAANIAGTPALDLREGSRLVASVEELLQEARRLDLSSTGGRFRLGELTEALHLALPAVADLHERLALDLEVDRDIITEAWFVASAFPPATRHPILPWNTYATLRFHPARHELADRAAREGWDQDRLGRELAAWFAARHDRRSEPSA